MTEQIKELHDIPYMFDIQDRELFYIVLFFGLGFVSLFMTTYVVAYAVGASYG